MLLTSYYSSYGVTYVLLVMSLMYSACLYSCIRRVIALIFMHVASYSIVLTVLLIFNAHKYCWSQFVYYLCDVHYIIRDK